MPAPSPASLRSAPSPAERERGFSSASSPTVLASPSPPLGGEGWGEGPPLASPSPPLGGEGWGEGPPRGRSQRDASLAPTTWFRVGGPAEFLVRPADAADLAAYLRALPPEMPVRALGACSNVIIRDGGLPGVTLRLARGFTAITPDGDGVIAGAGALDVTVAEHAAAAGLSGLEFLCGVPGTIGGAVAMNAGAYGGDIATVLDWAEIVTRSGEAMRLSAAALAFAYRHAHLPPGGVVVRARLRARASDPAIIAARMAEIRASREATQPIRSRTGGSTFRNPPDMKAWELIDAAGCRGLRRGGALVSEKHCNFLINDNDATAADIEGLGEEVRQRVLAAAGVCLEWEIRRIGVPGPHPPREEARRPLPRAGEMTC